MADDAQSESTKPKRSAPPRKRPGGSPSPKTEQVTSTQLLERVDALQAQLGEVQKELLMCRQRTDAVLNAVAFLALSSDDETRALFLKMMLSLNGKKSKKPEFYRQFHRIAKLVQRVEKLGEAE